MALNNSVKHSIIMIVGGVVVLALVAAAFWPNSNQRPIATPLSVTVTPVVQKPMPIVLVMPGNVVPTKTVSVKSQVTGRIEKIDFNYGDIVKENQLLFEIDQAPFIAALKQAQASFAQDKALLPALKSQLASYTALVKKGYVSSQDYEQARSNYESQKAKVAADTQDIEQAKISLNYTSITAPIAGKTGNYSVNPGDLVTANDTNPLVLINQIDPIEIDFYLPQNELPKLRRYQQQNPISVEVWNEKLTHKIDQGQLFFIDNQINNQTGTILLKADVNNTDHKIWPGQLVAVRLILTVEPNAVVIPANAVHSDQQGNFVWLAKNNQAVMTPITINRQVDSETVVQTGLTPGDIVITVAPPNLANNSPIKVAS